LLPCLIAGLWLCAFSIANPSPALAESEAQRSYLKLQQGRTALLRAQYQHAVGLLTEAIASAALPPDARAFALGHRGVARSRIGELRAAIHDFNAAIGLSPEDATLYNNRGNLLLELGLYTEAAKDFDQAVSLAPGYGVAYNNRGNALILLGDSAEALADFAKAIELMPLHAVPFNGRGRAQLELGRPAGALRDFSRAIELNGRYAQAYVNRAGALIAIHRYPEAIGDYSAAIELGGGTAELYRARASLYAVLKMRGPALADLAEARKFDTSAEGLGDELLAQQLLEADQIVTAALPAASQDPPASSPCGDGHTSSVDGAGLSKVADALHNVVSTTLLYRAASGDADRQIDPAAAYRTALDCATRSEGSPRPLAQMATAGEDGEQEHAPGNWTVERARDGVYIATHPEHPDLHLRLELYGSGEPELLHWQELDEPFGGIGLLHYLGGASPEGERLEYVAVIDTERDRLLAIEPASWGNRQAKWTWSETDLVVVDPQGVPSRIFLDGQISSKLKLNGRDVLVGRAKRPSRHQGQIAKRPKPRASSYADSQLPSWMRGYSRRNIYAQRLPPRFRHRRAAY
jgi:tetratricopeptide (TPR) repeat protein